MLKEMIYRTNSRVAMLVVPALVLLTAFVAVPPPSVYASDDPVPPEIRNLKMGTAESDVVQMIKDSGDYSTGPVPKREGRNRITWTPAESDTYKYITFDFTEKDRLCLMRFVLRDDLGWDVKSLKEQFFEKYGISWEFPGKMRVRDYNAILYIPEEKAPHFFELKHVRTGERIFEVFDKEISGRDRPRPPKRSKKSDQSAPQAQESADKAEGGKKVMEKEGASAPETPGDAADDTDATTRKTEDGAPTEKGDDASEASTSQ
jgi:hypothetical protein